MEEQEVIKVVKKELLEFEESYVTEKVYWQRTVRMIVIVVSMVMSLVGGIVAYGFKTSTEVTNNTQGRRDIERRMDSIERQHAVMMDNYNTVAKNQNEVLDASNRLSRKLDILIDRAGVKYRD